MTAPTTDNRPKDTIRDAFEAMLAFLTILIGGPMPRAWPDIAAVAARAIGSQARTTEEADRAVAALASFRDLIQRAAEEHNRRTADAGAFTPERIREARERCERATPGPWVHSPPGVDEPHVSTKIGSDSDRVDWIASPRSAPSKRWHDAAFIAHAREDLPAAIAEIERLNRLVVATANADPSWVERCTTQAAEIERLATALQAERAAWQEASGADSPGHLTAALKARRARLTAELAARVPALFDGPPRTLYQPNGPDGRPEDAGAPADASLEALGRIVRAAWVEVAKKEAKTVPGYVDLWKWLEIPDADTDRKIGEQVVRAVDASRPAAAIERTLNINALARCARAALRIEVPDVVAWEALPEAERVGWRAVVRCILASTTLASRPGLTEEQATDLRERAALIAETCSGGDHTITNRDLIAQRIRALPLRAARGEVGPAPAGEERPAKPCPAFFGLAGSVYGAQFGDRCDACRRTRAEHGASQ